MDEEEEEDPLVCVARWHRRRIRETSEQQRGLLLHEVIATDGGAQQLIQERIDALRKTRVSARRDAAIGRWLELRAMSSSDIAVLREAKDLLDRACHSRTVSVPLEWRRARKRTNYLYRAALTREEATGEGAGSREMPRLDASSSAEFVRREFLAKGVPCVITGGADTMVDREQWTLKGIALRQASRTVELKRRELKATRWASLTLAHRADLSNFLLNESDLYLHDWSLPLFAPELLKDFAVPPWLSGDRLSNTGLLYGDSWPSLFVGSQGTSSATHVDAAASHFCMALLQGGTKQWLVWPREEAGLLYPRFANGSDDLIFDADPLDDPQGAAHFGASPWHATQRPGDLLLVPSNCPHYVRNNEGRTVGLAMNFVDTSNVKEAMHALGEMDTQAASELRAHLAKGQAQPDDGSLQWETSKKKRPRSPDASSSPEEQTRDDDQKRPRRSQQEGKNEEAAAGSDDPAA